MNDERGEALNSLQADGISVTVLDDHRELASLSQNMPPDIVLLDTTSMSSQDQRECVEACHKLDLAVIGLIPNESLAKFDVKLALDDFVTLPIDAAELKARLRQLLWRTRRAVGSNVIVTSDLVIDLDKYEVSVKGKKVILTFKEYELLRILASHPGMVYTRETILSKVWGYGYYGGTRTVDVHVRRLRSKIEDTEHSFIETIWNVGYRFAVTTPS